MTDLTIIIPFYNETAYLRMAVQSVLAQTIDNIQVIIVNDNPEHFTADWFDQFGLPACVTVLHHPHNRGLSATRNTGMAKAKGTFIGFLDADDYYTSTGLTDQLEMAVESQADITHAPCYLSAMGTPAVQILRRDKLFFMQNRAVKGLLSTEEAQFITSSWSSLYRRAFLEQNNLRFDEDQPKFEDRLFVLHTVTAATRISYLGQPARVWRRRAGSISVTKTDVYIHRLQVQLLEKSLTHIRAQVALGKLPARFEKRELFNTVGRLIWDMDILPELVDPLDPAYEELGRRIQTLLGSDSFGHDIFDDPVLVHISRVGMKTKKGRITREMFFGLHKNLRDRDFEQVVKTLRAQTPAPYLTKSARVPLRKSLILHVGMHKTGSTFIQHNLLAHRDTLLRRGILVPKTGFDSQLGRSVRRGGLPGHQGILTAIRQNNASLLDELHQEVAQTTASKILISCENMLHPMSDNRTEALSALFEALAFFEERSCVAFVRRPDVQIEAYWRELVSNGNPLGQRSLPEFVNDAAPRLTDLESLFTPFEGFCGTAVRFANYDTAVQSGSLWSEFTNIAGLGGTLAPQDVPQYATPDRDVSELARLASVLIPAATQRMEVLQNLYATLPSGPARLSALPPEDRLGILRQSDDFDPAFAEQRGYKADTNTWRAEVERESGWTATSELPTNWIETLANARHQAETPRKTTAAPTEKIKRIYVPRKRRIRLRPWARNLLGLK